MSWTAARPSDAAVSEGAAIKSLAWRGAVAAAGLILVPLSGFGAAPDSGGGNLASALDREIEALQSELASVTGEERTTASDLDNLAPREALSRRRYEKAAWRPDEGIRADPPGQPPA